MIQGDQDIWFSGVDGMFSYPSYH